jgi:uncharacterized protein YuzE
MKLELLGMKPGEAPFVEIDECVPVAIQWPGYALLQQASKCLVLDASESLIEVKVDAEDGEVMGVVLVNARGVTRTDSPISLPSAIEAGIPVIGITDS